MSEAMTIRLRCMNKACCREFDRPESIIEDAVTFAREKRCPFCECDATTLADVQPRPPVWWSDSMGLIQRMPRTTGAEEIGYRVLDGGIGNRVIPALPLDAVPMVPEPETDEHRERRQRAADRVAAFLEQRAKTDDGSSRAEIYRLNHHRLLVDDLRLLIEAAPVLPPKWSGVLTDPIMHVVIDENGVVLLVTRDEERANRTARESDASVTSVAVDQ